MPTVAHWAMLAQIGPPCEASVSPTDASIKKIAPSARLPVRQELSRRPTDDFAVLVAVGQKLSIPTLPTVTAVTCFCFVQERSS